MRWQIDNSRPVYIQIMEHIRSAIDAGTFEDFRHEYSVKLDQRI